MSNSNREAVLGRLGRVHCALQADGEGVLRAVLKTCQEMLLDRGCLSVRASEDPVRDIVRGARVVWGTDGGGSTTDVYVSAEDKVAVKFVRGLPPADCVVVVSVDGPTPYTRRECEKQRIQFVSCRRLYSNVTRHELVVPHVAVAAPADVDVDDLPKIFDTDPVVQYYNWPVGTVVRTERFVGGHEPIPYFRVVTPAPV